MKFDLNTTYHIIEFNYSPPPEVIKWCNDRFGDTSNKRWYFLLNKIYFKNESDHILFTLRWS